VALGKVVRHELPPLGAEEERPARVEQQRDRPQPALQLTVGERRTISKPDPIAVLIARPITDERRFGSSRLASMNSAMCASRTTA
jgi:hypothetical protein